MAVAAAAGSMETLTPLCPPLPLSHARYLSKLMHAAEDLTNPHTAWLLSSNYWLPIPTELLGAAQEPDGTNRQRVKVIHLSQEHRRHLGSASGACAGCMVPRHMDKQSCACIYGRNTCHWISPAGHHSYYTEHQNCQAGQVGR